MLHPGMQNQPLAPQGEWNIPQGPARDVVLQTVRLTKAYGKRLAVNDLNLEVARGEVFGFLGPNGAGKTTTIRMMLNLIKPTFGEVRLFGQRLDQHPRSLLPRVGALIEQPAFQSYLSGRDNLVVVGGYTGGVDPSHILAEIRQFCTRIDIVRSGQLIATGGVDELLRSSSRWEVEVANPEQVCQLLSQVPILRSVGVEQGLVIIHAPTMRGRDLIHYLAQNNIWPESVRRSEQDLEHIFLRLTDKEAGL